MEPIYFVQNNMVDNLTVPVVKHANKHEIPFIDVSCIPDTNLDKCHDWQAPTMVFGSVGLMKQCRKHDKAGKYIFYDDVTFSALTWREELKNSFLNYDGLIMNAWEVPDILKTMDYHVRPLNDDKAFNGRVYTVETWNAMLIDRNLSSDVRCYVSPLKEIEKEYRCWFVGGILTEISLYATNGQLDKKRSTNTSIIVDAIQLTLDFMPYDTVVMDMAYCNDVPYIIEFNPIHSSGWYAADVSNVLTHLEDKFKKYT